MYENKQINSNSVLRMILGSLVLTSFFICVTVLLNSKLKPVDAQCVALPSTNITISQEYVGFPYDSYNSVSESGKLLGSHKVCFLSGKSEPSNCSWMSTRLACNLLQVGGQWVLKTEGYCSNGEDSQPFSCSARCLDW